MLLAHDTFLQRRRGMVLGLQSIEKLLGELGAPHLRYPHALVAGTNGKGSTSHYLAALMQSAGQTTGLYTSPHVYAFNERFQINRTAIADDQLRCALAAVDSAAKRVNLNPTFFESATAAAHVWFAQQNIHAAVLEVGLGGRLDATNVGAHDVVVLTDIDFDHTHILGNTAEAIAFEKAAVIQQGCDVVTAQKNPAVLAVIEKMAAERGASLWVLGRDFDLPYGIAAPLPGRHQKRNLALALKAFELWTKRLNLRADHSPAALQKSVADMTLPGRFQVISQTPQIIADGAHNPAAMEVLWSTVRERGFDPAKLHVLLATKSDKDWQGMLSAFPSGLAALWCTQVHAQTDAGGEGFIEPQTLATHAQDSNLLPRSCIHALNDPSLALAAARRAMGSGDTLLITGSFYLLGELFGGRT